MKVMSLMTSLVLLGLIGVVGCSTSSKKQDGIKVSYEEFQKLLSPKSIVLAEGKDLFFTVIAMPGDKYPMLYKYSMKTKKFSKEYDHGQGIGSISEDRNGSRIYLHIDNKGDENSKIYTYDPETHIATLLFGNKGRQAYVANTDKAGKNLFFISNHENKSIYSIYRMSFKTKKVDRLSDGKINLMGALVSEDGSLVAASRYLSNNENQVFLIHTKTKKMRRFFKKKNSVFNPSFFSSDGQFLYGTTDYKRDRKGCARIPMAKPNNIYYQVENKNKDISCGYAEWSKLYYLGETYNGKTEMKLFKTMFKNQVKIPKLFNNQSVSLVSFDRTNKKMLLKFSAANNPGSLYTFDIATLKTNHILDYNKSSIAMKDFATSYDFEYKSFDGMKIHGIIYAKEKWKTSGKKYPMVLWPHGGPDSSEGHRYRHWFQYLALNGFVVFAPNYRGSTGYGKKFETLNDKDWGGAHIKDLVAGRKAAEKLPYIDQNNVFIFGGSFGGYSTLATVTFHPEAFKAAVGFVAIGNLFTFMKSIPPDEAWQSEFIREMGDPVKDKELYKARSPFYHVDKIKIPLQIYQAENDIRTVKSEMDDFVAEMKKQGKSVEYTVLKDVGHGLARPESRKKVLEGTVKFFNSFIQ